MIDHIGFYTMTQARVDQQSDTSPMWRCEIEITSRCNFKCPYCRGLPLRGDVPLDKVLYTLGLWLADGLKNLRFSGGEPTIHPYLEDMVRYANQGGARIAVSTNGSAPLDLYRRLCDAGVSDWSVSLDACCASTASTMAGRDDVFSKVCRSVSELASRTYTTVGVVLTERNFQETIGIIDLAKGLGVDDIRLIPAAQCGRQLASIPYVSDENVYPILHYRLEEARDGRSVRGLDPSKDSSICWLVRDDSVVVGDYHYPCVIYMREKGDPVGKVGPDMRRERIEWCRQHDSLKDPICKNNCLDVCREFNNLVTQKELRRMP